LTRIGWFCAALTLTVMLPLAAFGLAMYWP
jgi:hypothetical protein